MMLSPYPCFWPRCSDRKRCVEAGVCIAADQNRRVNEARASTPPPAGAPGPTAEQRQAAEACIRRWALDDRMDTGNVLLTRAVAALLADREAAARRQGAEGLRTRAAEVCEAYAERLKKRADVVPSTAPNTKRALYDAAEGGDACAAAIRALPLEDPT